MSAETILKTATVEGVVEFNYTETGGKCACCPGGEHAFVRTVTLDRWWPDAPRYYEAWGTGAGDFVEFVACMHAFVGKRVRITVEVLEDREIPAPIETFEYECQECAKVWRTLGVVEVCPKCESPNFSSVPIEAPHANQ